LIDIIEIRLARTLGRVIEEELQKGNDIPDEVKQAFLELKAHWDWQIEKELS
jgi:hypothetical protein